MEVCVFFVILLMMPFIKSLPPLHPEKKKSQQKNTHKETNALQSLSTFFFSVTGLQLFFWWNLGALGIEGD